MISQMGFSRRPVAAMNTSKLSKAEMNFGDVRSQVTPRKRFVAKGTDVGVDLDLDRDLVRLAE